MAWSCRRGPSPRRGTNLRPGLAGRGQEELRPLQTDGLGLLSCRSRGGRHVVPTALPGTSSTSRQGLLIPTIPSLTLYMGWGIRLGVT